MPPKPLDRLDATGLIRRVDEQLIPLLRALEAEDWQLVAVGSWAVRDVVAHLLDGALRRLALDRDGHQPPPPGRDLSDYGEMLEFLNELNASWVEAAQRLSPEVMIDLLEQVCPQVADYLDSLDPEGEAAFRVSWAGEDASRVWMDVAREFTERWHHQQQIRDAVGAAALDQECYLRPLLETFMRALPRSYASIGAPAGATIMVSISDLDGLSWVLERQPDIWKLGRADTDKEADVRIDLPAEVAWKLFTKAITSSEARSRAQVMGDKGLAQPFFSTLAIMA